MNTRQHHIIQLFVNLFSNAFLSLNSTIFSLLILSLISAAVSHLISASVNAHASVAYVPMGHQECLNKHNFQVLGISHFQSISLTKL
jgi:hypothetical protein